MSSSDDDNSNEGESSPPSANGRPRKTMLGMGFIAPPPLPQTSDSPDEPDERSDNDPKGLLGALRLPPPRRRATDESDDEFPDEATQLAEHIGHAVIDDEEEVAERAEVDEAWDDIFPEEATQVAENLDFPDDGPPADRPQSEEAPQPSTIGADVSTELPWEDGIDGISLAEDSLPEAIHDPAPTLDDAPTPPDSAEAPEPPMPEDGPTMVGVSYVGDNAPITEFEGAKTELLDSPFESDPSVGKLVALEGPAAGQEFFASALRNTVGRGTNNSIVVPDLAMSRQHFEVVRNPDDTFSLVDLQSINGTMLNGTKVREADLFHGDRVEAGKSRFQFVITGNAPPPSRQRRLVPAATATMGGQPAPVAAIPAPSNAKSVNRLFLIISIAAVLVSLVLVLVIAMIKLKDPPAAGPEKADAAATYLLGVEAVKARNWDQAQAQFERASELDPQLDGVAGQLRRIEVERKAEATMARARELLDRELHDEAVAALEDIPRDSVYSTEAQDLLREARKAGILSLYQEAQDAMASEDFDRARELVDALLERVPTHQGALALREQLQSAPSANEADAGSEEAEETAVATTKRRPRSHNGDDWAELIGSSKKHSSRSRSKHSDTSVRVPNLTTGFVLYRTRKFKEAEDFFVKAAAQPGPAAASTRKIADAVKDFRSKYPPGVASFKAGNWADAERKLVAAKRADSVVGDYFDRDIKTKLATIEAQLGLARLAKGDAVAARKLLDKGKAFNPSDPTVSKLNRALEDEARSLYVKAQAAKKSDPAEAGKLCRQIKAIVGSSSEMHKKAAKLLDSLPSR